MDIGYWYHGLSGMEKQGPEWRIQAVFARSWSGSTTGVYTHTQWTHTHRQAYTVSHSSSHSMFCVRSLRDARRRYQGSHHDTQCGQHVVLHEHHGLWFCQRNLRAIRYSGESHSKAGNIGIACTQQQPHAVETRSAQTITTSTHHLAESFQPIDQQESVIANTLFTYTTTVPPPIFYNNIEFSWIHRRERKNEKAYTRENKETVGWFLSAGRSITGCCKPVKYICVGTTHRLAAMTDSFAPI